MRHLLLAVPFLMSLAVAGLACGEADELASEPPVGSGASDSFEVRLVPNVTTDDVIPAIVHAGHDQLAALCNEYPGVSIRVFNPLVSGSYEDVGCSTILGGSEATRQESTALGRDGERIGTAQQPLSPFSLVCGVLVLGATLAWNWPYGQEGCNTPGAENPGACRAVTSFGGGAMGLLCDLI